MRLGPHGELGATANRGDPVPGRRAGAGAPKPMLVPVKRSNCPSKLLVKDPNDISDDRYKPTNCG
jgi:hypothetical protein